MMDGSGGATTVLGMEGFVVLSVTEEDGEVFFLVEAAADLARCPRCGVRATGHGRSVTQVRDLPVSGRPVRLVWKKRRWLCTDADCPATSFTESSTQIEDSLTQRAAKEICRRVGQDGSSVAQVARDIRSRIRGGGSCPSPGRSPRAMKVSTTERPLTSMSVPAVLFRATSRVISSSGPG